MRSSSLPAAPTKGRPNLSSSPPGPSPINIILACGSPSPKTTCLAPLCSGQRRHLRQSSLHSSRELMCKVFFNSGSSKTVHPIPVLKLPRVIIQYAYSGYIFRYIIVMDATESDPLSHICAFTLHPNDYILDFSRDSFLKINEKKGRKPFQ